MNSVAQPSVTEDMNLVTAVNRALRGEMARDDVLQLNERFGIRRVQRKAQQAILCQEPAIADPLVHHPHVLATPHLGYVTWETYESYFGQAFEQINAFAAGAPVGVVNAEALSRV